MEARSLHLHSMSFYPLGYLTGPKPILCRRATCLKILLLKQPDGQLGTFRCRVFVVGKVSRYTFANVSLLQYQAFFPRSFAPIGA